eukprot:4026610-Amphidinium_carterae.1
MHLLKWVLSPLAQPPDASRIVFCALAHALFESCTPLHTEGINKRHRVWHDVKTEKKKCIPIPFRTHHKFWNK